MPVSEADVVEYQRAARVLTALSGVDPARVGGECAKVGQCNFASAFTASHTALAVVHAKDPATLTEEDVITVAGIMGAWAVQFSTSLGIDATFHAAGMTSGEGLSAVMPAVPLTNIRTPSDEFSLGLLPIAFKLLEAPEKLPELTLAGVMYTVVCGLVGRPAVAAKLLRQCDAVGVLMKILRAATPTELIATAGHAQKANGLAISVMKDLAETAQAGGIDMSGQLLSCVSSVCANVTSSS